jgi:penicillin amidase
MKWLGLGLALSLLVIAAVIGGAYLWLRTSLPTIDGEIRVSGLAAPVEIIRDAYGIPHIYAVSERSL